MNSELETLDVVDGYDRRTRELERAAAKQRQAVADATEALSARNDAAERLREALAANKTDQHAANRKAHLYTQRKESALRILERGSGDPAAAERQLRQCNTILDDTETNQLELMETQEALEAELDSAAKAISEAEAELERVGREATIRIERIDKDLAETATKRAESWRELDREIQDRYVALVRRKRTAVAHITGGACHACQRMITAQHLSDLRKGRLTPCRGCHRWLIPPSS